MGIIAWIILGALAGFIAHLLVGERSGIIGTVVLGIVGAVVGGFIAGSILHLADITGLNAESLAVAVVGAIVVVLVRRLLSSTLRRGFVP